MNSITRGTIKRAVAAARAQVQQKNFAGAMVSLAPIWADMAEAIASEIGNPVCLRESWDYFGPKLVTAWRDSIAAWKQEDFQGDPPAVRALRMVAEQALQDTSPVFEGCEATYRGAPALHFLSSLAGQVYGKGAEMDHLIVDELEQLVRNIWREELVKAAVPKGLYTGLTWFPGMGKSLDYALDTMTIKTNGWYANRLQDILACDGLRNFLEAFRIDSEELLDHVQRTRPDEVFQLLKNAVDGSLPLPLKPQDPLAPEHAIQILENGLDSRALPVVFYEVNVAALFELDPRKPIRFERESGRGQHIGLHNCIDCAGHMDGFPGYTVMPPLQLGLMSDAELNYGIAETYDIYRSAVRCTPKQHQGQEQAIAVTA